MSIKRPVLTGILYAEDFDAPPDRAPAEPAVPDIIEPVFTLAELEAAKRAVREETDRAVRAEFEAGIAQARRSALDAIGLALADADRAGKQLAEEAADAVAAGMLATLTAALPALMARHAGIEARAIARAVLPHLTTEPRVTLRVHDDLAEAMREELARLDPDLADRVILQPTAAMARGDIRIGWQDGGARRDTAAIWEDIKSALGPLGLLDPPPARPLPASLTLKESELVD